MYLLSANVVSITLSCPIIPCLSNRCSFQSSSISHKCVAHTTQRADVFAPRDPPWNPGTVVSAFGDIMTRSYRQQGVVGVPESWHFIFFCCCRWLGWLLCNRESLVIVIAMSSVCCALFKFNFNPGSALQPLANQSGGHSDGQPVSQSVSPSVIQSASHSVS